MSNKTFGRQPLSLSKCHKAPELAAVQDLMPISADDRAALRESIERDGIREPLRGYYDENGDFMVLSGLNRLEIAKELGLPLVPIEFVETDDREAFAIDENRARRQLSLDGKRRLAAWLLKRHPERSDRQVGQQAGVSKNTAGAVRADLERRGQIDHVEKRTDSKGRKQAASKPKATKKTPPDRMASPQSASKDAGQGTGSAYKAASGAFALLRSVIPQMTKAEKKDARKALQRLIQDTEL